MKPTFNPWTNLLLNQLWLCELVNTGMIECVDHYLHPEPELFSDQCPAQSERCLNPMEFHGRRRATSHGSVSGD